jgi:hypothetical protein
VEVTASVAGRAKARSVDSTSAPRSPRSLVSVAVEAHRALAGSRGAGWLNRKAAASRNLSPSLYVNPMSGERSNFNARAMARWLASRGRPHAKRQPPGPRPTLVELQRSHCWTWVYCEKCLHHAPMALVPLIIR